MGPPPPRPSPLRRRTVATKTKRAKPVHASAQCTPLKSPALEPLGGAAEESPTHDGPGAKAGAAAGPRSKSDDFLAMYSAKFYKPVAIPHDSILEPQQDESPAKVCQEYDPEVLEASMEEAREHLLGMLHALRQLCSQERAAPRNTADGEHDDVQTHGGEAEPAQRCEWASDAQNTPVAESLDSVHPPEEPSPSMDHSEVRGNAARGTNPSEAPSALLAMPVSVSGLRKCFDVLEAQCDAMARLIAEARDAANEARSDADYAMELVAEGEERLSQEVQEKAALGEVREKETRDSLRSSYQAERAIRRLTARTKIDGREIRRLRRDVVDSRGQAAELEVENQALHEEVARLTQKGDVRLVKAVGDFEGEKLQWQRARQRLSAELEAQTQRLREVKRRAAREIQRACEEQAEVYQERVTGLRRELRVRSIQTQKLEQSLIEQQNVLEEWHPTAADRASFRIVQRLCEEGSRRVEIEHGSDMASLGSNDRATEAEPPVARSDAQALDAKEDRGQDQGSLSSALLVLHDAHARLQDTLKENETLRLRLLELSAEQAACAEAMSEGDEAHQPQKVTLGDAAPVDSGATIAENLTSPRKRRPSAVQRRRRVAKRKAKSSKSLPRGTRSKSSVEENAPRTHTSSKEDDARSSHSVACESPVRVGPAADLRAALEDAHAAECTVPAATSLHGDAGHEEGARAADETFTNDNEKEDNVGVSEADHDTQQPVPKVSEQAVVSPVDRAFAVPKEQNGNQFEVPESEAAKFDRLIKAPLVSSVLRQALQVNPYIAIELVAPLDNRASIILSSPRFIEATTAQVAETLADQQHEQLQEPVLVDTEEWLEDQPILEQTLRAIARNTLADCFGWEMQDPCFRYAHAVLESDGNLSSSQVVPFMLILCFCHAISGCRVSQEYAVHYTSDRNGDGSSRNGVCAPSLDPISEAAYEETGEGEKTPAQRRHSNAGESVEGDGVPTPDALAQGPVVEGRASSAASHVEDAAPQDTPTDHLEAQTDAASTGSAPTIGPEEEVSNPPGAQQPPCEANTADSPLPHSSGVTSTSPLGRSCLSDQADASSRQTQEGTGETGVVNGAGESCASRGDGVRHPETPRDANSAISLSQSESASTLEAQDVHGSSEQGNSDIRASPDDPVNSTTTHRPCPMSDTQNVTVKGGSEVRSNDVVAQTTARPHTAETPGSQAGQHGRDAEPLVPAEREAAPVERLQRTVAKFVDATIRRAVANTTAPGAAEQTGARQHGTIETTSEAHDPGPYRLDGREAKSLVRILQQKAFPSCGSPKGCCPPDQALEMFLSFFSDEELTPSFQEQTEKIVELLGYQRVAVMMCGELFAATAGGAQRVDACLKFVLRCRKLAGVDPE